MSTEIRGVFQNTVHEGESRLTRTWPALLATGAVGGIDVSMGVLALLLTQTALHNEVASAIAFGIGFLALSLANSELFTENFLVPIAAIVAKRAPPLSLLRLWAGTLATNLIGGWIFLGIVIAAVPQVRSTAITVGTVYVREGVSWTSFASALLGGAIITLMTWMQHGTDSAFAKIIAAFAAAFLLAAGHLNHAIVASLEMFAALHAGATFGYLTYLRLLGWACLGNIIGGIAFVTVLRLVQVGAEAIRVEREQPTQAENKARDDAGHQPTSTEGGKSERPGRAAEKTRTRSGRDEDGSGDGAVGDVGPGRAEDEPGNQSEERAGAVR